MAAGPPNPRELAMVVASAVAGALSQQNTPTNPSTSYHSHDLTATTSSTQTTRQLCKLTLVELYAILEGMYVVALEVNVQSFKLSSNNSFEM